MNNFCPFIKDTCNSSCVFYTHKTGDTSGMESCKLLIAASSVDEYCDLKIREMEGNLPNHHSKK